MKREIKVIEYTCDNPKCGKAQTMELEDDFIGLSGTVMEITKDHGGGTDWFACSRKCVGSAVAAALDKIWSHDE